MESFDAVRESIFRRYIRSAVIIDDQWPEHEIVLHGDATDESEFMAEEDETEIVATAEQLEDSRAAPPQGPSSDKADSEMLGSLRRALLREGVLTCGLRYRKKDRGSAIRLAKGADIVVLDWNLVHDDGAEALEILRKLQGDSLRFVCIWTGHDRAEEVRERLLDGLCPPKQKEKRSLEGASKGDLRLANLVIAIRVKEGLKKDPELQIGPDRLLEVAIRGLSHRFGGLVQLSMLEMTQRHREQLPEILERIGSSIDTAVLLEAADEDSPVGPGGAFLGVLVDEWQSHLEQVHGDFSVLSKRGRCAFGTELAVELSRMRPEVLQQFLVHAGIAAGSAKTYSEKAVPQLVDWMKSGCLDNLPGVQGVSFRKKKDDLSRNAAWGVLSAVTEREDFRRLDSLGEFDVLEPLLRLDTLFYQQFELPAVLTQGTVVRTQRGSAENYLICTTPFCDANRPKNIGGLYTFVRTRTVSPEKILSGAGVRWYCVIEDRMKDQGICFCLEVLIKERVSLEVSQRDFDDRGVVNAWLSIGGEGQGSRSGSEKTELHRVAQLRFEHALAVSNASAADAARVGVNRVELVRSRLRRGRNNIPQAEPKR